MKKYLLFFIALFILSCSSDRDSENSNNNTNPPIAIETLNDATITPINSSVIGYEQKIEYILKKGTKTLSNTDYSWSVSDTLHGRTNVYGHFYSRIIGETNVIVKDNNGNSLTTNVKINPKITDIPNIPFVKWGATNSEIKRNINSDWALVDDQYLYPDLIFKKGKIAVKYNISVSGGLYSVQMTDNFTYGWDEGFTDPNKLTDFNDERFIKLKNNDPNYFGYNKWWYTNPIDNKKVYTYLSASSQQGPYLLQYKQN